MKMILRDGTGSVALKFLVEDVDRHGNVRIYFRRHGRKIRLGEVPGTNAFMAEYRQALSGESAPVIMRTPASRGSLRWLVEHYYQSPEFMSLGERTRTVRRGILDAICERYGTKPFVCLEARHVRTKIRDEKAAYPEAANARVKALGRVFAWAVEVGHADSNPAREVPRLASKNPDGFHAWTVDEVRQFEARHPIGSKARLALALFLYTGVRRSDAVLLGRQMERDGWFCFTEAKGRARRPKVRELPILPELRAVIDKTPSDHLTYLVTASGKPFSVAGFGNWFRKRCDEAGLHHCSAHGLRKAGATTAADQGATEHQLMAIYGWNDPKQAALYTRRANRKKLAGDAMHLVVPGRKENGSVPLSTVVA